MSNVALICFERKTSLFPFDWVSKGSVSAIFQANGWDQSKIPNSLQSGREPIWGFQDSEEERKIWQKTGRFDLLLFEDQEGIYAWGRVKKKSVGPQTGGNGWSTFLALQELNSLNPTISPERIRRVLGLTIRRESTVKDLSDVGLLAAEFLELLLRDSTRMKVGRADKQNERNRTQSLDSTPYVGQTFKNREQIWQKFGGQKVWGISKFTNSDIVNVFSKEDGPYPDNEDPDTGVIEYRGQGLTGDQALSLGNKHLEEARMANQAIRYWKKPSGGIWRFEKWVVVADYEFIEEPDVNGVLARRILWYLEPVTSPSPEHWLPTQRFRTPQPKSNDEAKNDFVRKDFATRYRLLSQKAESALDQSLKSSPTLRSSYRRNRALRELVLERSENSCENDGCTGMPPDKKPNGQAILEVDHIDPLSENGSDHPTNMVALCPNCHTAKTFGAEKRKMIRRLKIVVTQKEKRIL